MWTGRAGESGSSVEDSERLEFFSGAWWAAEGVVVAACGESKADVGGRTSAAASERLEEGPTPWALVLEGPWLVG